MIDLIPFGNLCTATTAAPGSINRPPSAPTSGAGGVNMRPAPRAVAVTNEAAAHQGASGHHREALCMMSQNNLGLFHRFKSVLTMIEGPREEIWFRLTAHRYASGEPGTAVWRSIHMPSNEETVI